MSSDADQSPEGPRRRIVIPLNREQQGSQPSRSGGHKASQKSVGNNRAPSSRSQSRAGRLLAILGIIIVAIVLSVAGGIFLWWQHYKTTPAYSLALLVDAAQRNDMATVDTIIDTDRIVDNFAGKVTDKAVGRYGVPLGPLARKQIESLAPKLLPTIRQSVHEALAIRIKEISENSGHKPFIVLALGLPYSMNVAVSGDSATATASVQDQPVELDLQRAESSWKVIAFKDEALVQRIIDKVIKDLPAVGEGADIRKHGRKQPPAQQRILIP